MNAKAISKNVRVSPLKLRVYADSIRGKKVDRAVHWLRSQSLNRVVPIEKTVISAYHNALQADSSISGMEQLRIKEIRIDQGATVRYFKPTAQGRVSPQRKRFSHISVIVEKCSESKEV